jgi:thiol-disulfide isomerase/thioredoxin
MADEHRPIAKAQMPLSSGSVYAERHRGGGEPGASARRLSARKGSPLSRGRRRTALTVMAAVFVLVGAALAASHFTAGGSTTGRVVDGSTVEYTAGHRPLVPDITGVSLTGTAIKMSSYRGKVLVLNFWGSWCGPCRAEAPTLEVAYQQYHAQGVDFLGDDVGDTPTNALSFTHSERISYPSINDPGYSVVQQFSQAAPVSYPPTTAVIDKTGHVVGMVLGPVSISELTPLLHQAASA